MIEESQFESIYGLDECKDAWEVWEDSDSVVLALAEGAGQAHRAVHCYKVEQAEALIDALSKAVAFVKANRNR